MMSDGLIWIKIRTEELLREAERARRVRDLRRPVVRRWTRWTR